MRPLGAGSPRGGALRGSSALAPGLGLVAASVWSRPFGRAVNGPGLGPALPTRRPRGLVLLKVRRGGEGGSRPRPLGASLPPPAACGPLPLPTLGGLGAARPARLRRSGKCGGGRRLRRLRSSRRLPLLGGTLPQSKAKPLRGRSAGLALLLPLAGCGVGAPGRPGPHEWGLWGRPPLRPGRACLRPAAPRWPACGAACAAAALPPLGPPGVAAPPAAASRRRAAGGVRASLACGPCPGPWPSRSARPVRGRNLDAAR